MTRYLYDSTNIEDIPGHATMVGCYVDGLYANHAKAQRRFPHATLVTITVLGKPGAQVVDCEPGDLGPAGAAQWAKNELDAGRKPTIYCMASQWGTVNGEVKALGIKAHEVSWWIADYDGDPTVPPGAVAKQYADPDLTGHHFDRSVVADYWPGVDPEPTPQPSPQRAQLAKAQRLLRRVIRLLAKGNKK